MKVILLTWLNRGVVFNSYGVCSRETVVTVYTPLQCVHTCVLWMNVHVCCVKARLYLSSIMYSHGNDIYLVALNYGSLPAHVLNYVLVRSLLKVGLAGLSRTPPCSLKEGTGLNERRSATHRLVWSLVTHWIFSCSVDFQCRCACAHARVLYERPLPKIFFLIHAGYM